MENCCARLGPQKNTNVRISLPAVCFVWQIAMIILFGIFVRYNEEADTHWIEHKQSHNITSDIENDFYFRYPSKYTHISDYALCSFAQETVCRCNY